MNTPVLIGERERLQQELAIARQVFETYKNLIGLDQPVSTKLVDHALKSISIVNVEIRRTERAIAKLDATKGRIDKGTK